MPKMTESEKEKKYAQLGKEMHQEIHDIIRTYAQMIDSADDFSVDVFQGHIGYVCASILAGIVATVKANDKEKIQDMINEVIKSTFEIIKTNNKNWGV